MVLELRHKLSSCPDKEALAKKPGGGDAELLRNLLALCPRRRVQRITEISAEVALLVFDDPSAVRPANLYTI